jgi:hypothetical protein
VAPSRDGCRQARLDSCDREAVLCSSDHEEGDATDQACRKSGGIAACNIVDDERVGEACEGQGEGEEMNDPLSEQSKSASQFAPRAKSAVNLIERCPVAIRVSGFERRRLHTQTESL